ncbi:hypothetical protein Anas_03908 [Armadillidium nasatum]|uniref:Uncharacterized protein n=1 Tax=Armadillidium nasatum TaxID=96803 RepID=A0A5N5SKE8_9CRUS|nr:hypothetical protein Anas_03908 [Armadillidium nasatum]
MLLSILEGDSSYKSDAKKLQPLMKEQWKKVEENIEPLKTLLNEIVSIEEEEKKKSLENEDLSGLGGWLGSVKRLTETVKQIKDSENVAMMQILKKITKTLLIEELKKQQIFIHQLVTK